MKICTKKCIRRIVLKLKKKVKLLTTEKLIPPHKNISLKPTTKKIKRNMFFLSIAFVKKNIFKKILTRKAILYLLTLFDVFKLPKSNFRKWLNSTTTNITTLDSLRQVDKFTYLGSSDSSTENDIDTRLTKAWTALDRLSIIWKSDLTDEMKRSFFQAAVVSILLYGCTTWTLTKRLEKKLDGNYIRMLRAILNKSWRQHPTRRQLYGHLPPITKAIQVRRARHAGHCWRSKDEVVSDVLLWTPTYGQAKAGRPARTYIQQLCEDTGCNPEDLLEAMNDREKWREMVKDICAGGTTWWWWLLFFYTHYAEVPVV